MSHEIALRTRRLELVAATLDHVLAELRAPADLAALLLADVPASWPPGEYDGDALEYFRTKLAEGPDAVGWYGWYAISLTSDGSRQSVVAGAGYLGPPTPDGIVEIGYSVVPEERGRGYATEAVQALVDRALNTPTVRLLIAHTDVSNIASSTVLRRCGFKLVGSGQEPGSARYELSRSAT